MISYHIPARRKYGARKIFVAIPSRTDKMPIATMLCIQDAMLDALIRGWAFDIRGFPGIEPISNCRNYIVAQFLASDCDDLLFIDDDLQWQKGAVNRLLDHEVDFVIGVYPYRADPVGFPVRILRQRIEIDPVTGLLEVNGGGFGFARVTRRCVEKMVRSYPELAYPEKGCPNDTAHMLFQLNVLVDGVQFSEDMMFAKRWQDIGGKMWCDPEITFVHMGMKGFVGHYGDWLRKVTVMQREDAERAKSAA